MQVQKTPVSMLQEMMVKKGIVPNYELIHDGGGTHDNTFTYKVSCDGCSAIGSGRCKKDAKHTAAKKLLEAIVARNNYPQLPASPAQSPVHTPLPESIHLTHEISADKPFINAVGALQDICADNNLQSPTYIQISDVGPPHAKVFTIQCVVSTFKEEGKAKTKKQAKHEAAQKMLARLREVVSDMKIDSASNYNSADSETSLVNENVKNRYVELTKISSKKVNLGIKLNEYHLRLKKTFSDDKRNEFLENLRKLQKLSFPESSEVSSELAEKLISKLEEFFTAHNIVMQFQALKSKEPDNVMSVIQLNTGPDVLEIGFGRSKAEADINALRELINTMILFLA